MSSATITVAATGGYDTYGYYGNVVSRGSENTIVHMNENTKKPIVKINLSSLLSGITVDSVSFYAEMIASGTGNHFIILQEITDSNYANYGEATIFNWYSNAPASVTAIGELNVSNTAGLKTWDSDDFPALITTVQGWIDNPATNYGFILATSGTFTADGATDRQFYSKEGGGGHYIPSLSITYHYEYDETAKIQTIGVITSGSDAQSMVETGKELTILSTQGGTDNYSANETGRVLTILSTQGEADIQSMVETGKLQSIAAIVTESDILTMVETGALLLMKAWIVSRFPWAFSEVDLKTATFSERRNINT